MDKFKFFTCQSLEASRLQPVLKGKERAQEVNQRVMDMNESFSKETEKKLQEKMDAMQEKKNAQIQALLDRLSLHVCIVCFLIPRTEHIYLRMEWSLRTALMYSSGLNLQES